MKFVHTSDWQVGRPFARVEDERKRALLQQERIAVISRIGDTARRSGAEFIVVAGDLFDSPTATKPNVVAACEKIGAIGLPVYVISGNHDHGGPGSVWEQEFFRRESAALAPNLCVLRAAQPIEVESAILLPCPLRRRADPTDPTAWLRSDEVLSKLPGGKPRIVIAHGSTQGFGAAADVNDDELEPDAINRIDLSRLPASEYDYLALGDWHGTKQVEAKAWYSGTPEPDRFPKGGDYSPGNVLVVSVTRAGLPVVSKVSTVRLGWHELPFDFSSDAAIDELQRQIGDLLGTRADADLLSLRLAGSLGIEATSRLETLIESLQARLLRLKLSNQVQIAPTDAEIQALTQRASDPLLSSVAAQLVARSAGSDDGAKIARIALRELHAACAGG